MKVVKEVINKIADWGMEYSTLLVGIGLLFSVIINNYNTAVLIALIGILLKLEKFDK